MEEGGPRDATWEAVEMADGQLGGTLAANTGRPLPRHSHVMSVLSDRSVILHGGVGPRGRDSGPGGRLSVLNDVWRLVVTVQRAQIDSSKRYHEGRFRVAARWEQINPLFAPSSLAPEPRICIRTEIKNDMHKELSTSTTTRDVRGLVGHSCVSFGTTLIIFGGKYKDDNSQDEGNHHNAIS